MWEHKQVLMPGFTRDYGVTMLVWYEGYDRLIDAGIENTASRSGGAPGSSD